VPRHTTLQKLSKNRVGEHLLEAKSFLGRRGVLPQLPELVALGGDDSLLFQHLSPKGSLLGGLQLELSLEAMQRRHNRAVSPITKNGPTPASWRSRSSGSRGSRSSGRAKGPVHAGSPFGCASPPQRQGLEHAAAREVDSRGKQSGMWVAQSADQLPDPAGGRAHPIVVLVVVTWISELAENLA
jgi:hypothetical protein